MVGSRFNQQVQLTVERLKDFVALDNLTAQTPLIEMSRVNPPRIWTAYDITRTHGTFTEMCPDGSVKTVTIYPSGKRHEIFNRPSYNIKRVQQPKEQDTVKRRSRRVSKVPKVKQAAVSSK
jgi:hypothetical protein